VPVGFDFNGNYFYVGGMNLLKSTKYKNVLRNNMVAIVIDDLKTIDPWDPRVMKMYGIADIVTRQGGYTDRIDHPNPGHIELVLKRNGVGGLTNMSL
jgi:pyridoxamine 5'-phosphate oxidase family protein